MAPCDWPPEEGGTGSDGWVIDETTALDPPLTAPCRRATLFGDVSEYDRFLDKQYCRSYGELVTSTASGSGRPDLLVVRDRAQAAALLQPQRVRLLEGLGEPDSAAGLARRLQLPRQQVNYHLRELERVGLVELVEERRRGNCVERVVVATARRYLIGPEVLGGRSAEQAQGRDCFSPSCLLAAAARTIRELSALQAEAEGDGARLTTMTLETEVRFAGVGERNAFAKELSDAIARLVVKYHHATAARGQSFRVVVGAHPLPGNETGREPERGSNHDR